MIKQVNLNKVFKKIKKLKRFNSCDLDINKDNIKIKITKDR